MPALIRKTLLALTLVATFSAFTCAAALADSVATAAALTKMELADSRPSPSVPDDEIARRRHHREGRRYRRRHSLLLGRGQLASCVMMAVNAATYLDLERSGQTTFAALTDKLESQSGARAEAINGLNLAESAPANVSPDQLGRSVYKQCSSYVVIQ